MRIRHIEIRNFRGIKHFSWPVPSEFNCILGPGDVCKTTILTALDYALSPRASLPIEDADFYGQDVHQDIVIQVTLTEWDDTNPAIRKLLREHTFAQFQCGVDLTGPLPEPSDDHTAISISLRIDSSLDPKWFVVKGRDQGDASDRKPIYASDRAVLGFTRIESFSDYHFSWGRTSLLARLSTGDPTELSGLLSTLARQVRQGDISAYNEIAQCQSIADSIKVDATAIGVGLATLSPQIDLHRQPLGTSALSLHEGSVPVRNKGDGSKKLIAAAMQMHAKSGTNISAIDELEAGLEPYRIRGLISRLKARGQQIFLTTHSPVVIRELDATANELYLCGRDHAGIVRIRSLASVPNIQASVRSNAEAFLGSTIVACEGRTEIGCLRAYDTYRFSRGATPVWSLSTAYFDCNGSGNIAKTTDQLVDLGYRVAILCDNDAPDSLSEETIDALEARSVHLCRWNRGNSTENQLFDDLLWRDVPTILEAIASAHDTLVFDTIVQSIVQSSRDAGLILATDPETWPESVPLRRTIATLAHKRGWIKRIDLAQTVFQSAFERLPETTTLQQKLLALWTWVEDG